MGNASPNLQVGRTQVRSTLANFIEPPAVGGINQVFTTFPKRIDFNKMALTGERNRCAAVIFIESENDTRIANGGFNGSDGGVHAGWKRVDYGVVIQLFHHSMERDAADAMANFDFVVDNLKQKLRSDHTFGDLTGTLVWQGAEPGIDCIYGEPLTQKDTSIETWASVRFLVTQMIQA